MQVLRLKILVGGFESQGKIDEWKERRTEVSVKRITLLEMSIESKK